MSDELVIVAIDILVDDLEPMLEFAAQLFSDQLDHFGIIHISKLRIPCTELPQEAYLVYIEIGQSSALDLVLYLQVPAFYVLVFVDENCKGIDQLLLRKN